MLLIIIALFHILLSTSPAFQSKSSVTASLEKPVLSFIRSSLELTPLSIVGPTSYLIRSVLKYGSSPAIKYNDGCVKPRWGDVLSLASSNQNGEDIIIYIHGGGFVLCDSGDILLSERLLSRIGKLYSSKAVPKICSILYSTVPAMFSNQSLYEIVTNQVVDAFDDIFNTLNNNARIVGIIGDSAGGNLALSTLLRLQALASTNNTWAMRNEALATTRLCLISPWLDLYSKAPSYERNKDNDMIGPSFLCGGRDQYIGKAQTDVIAKQVRLLSKKRLVLQLASLCEMRGIKTLVIDLGTCSVGNDGLKLLGEETTVDFGTVLTTMYARGIILTVVVTPAAAPALVTGPHPSNYSLFPPSAPTLDDTEQLVGRVLKAKLPPPTHEGVSVLAFNNLPMKQVEDQEADREGMHGRHLLVQRAVAERLAMPESAVAIVEAAHRGCQHHRHRLRPDRHAPPGGLLLQQAVAALQARPMVQSTNISPARQPSALSSTPPLASKSLSMNTMVPTTPRPRTAMLGMEEAEFAASFVPSDSLPMPLEYICPLYATEAQLAGLPECLVIAGGNELFIDDIALFADRLTSAQLGTVPRGESALDQRTRTPPQHGQPQQSPSVHLNLNANPALQKRSRLLVAEGEVHAYPLMWRHPVHRVLAPMGLSWLFRLLFPLRHAIALDQAVSDAGSTRIRARGEDLQAVHSPTAARAVEEIAHFLIGGIASRDDDREGLS